VVHFQPIITSIGPPSKHDMFLWWFASGALLPMHGYRASNYLVASDTFMTCCKNNVKGMQKEGKDG
jgi:hypothetical protein